MASSSPYQEKVLTSGTAWRFSVVPTGFVAASITNANDGEPVVGASHHRLPRRSQDHNDSLRRLVFAATRSGSYTITIDAKNYEPCRARTFGSSPS